MGLGIVAAFGAAALYNLSAVIMKTQAQRESVNGLRLIVRLARRPVWLVAIALSLCGFGLHFFALTQAPVTVVQPIIAAGILFVVPFAFLILDEKPHRRELIGTVIAIAGIVVLMTSIGEESELDPFTNALLAAALVVIAVAIVACLVTQRRLAHLRPVVAGVFIGLAAGAAQGTSDAMNRLMGAGVGYEIPAAILLLGFGLVGFTTMQTGLRQYRATTVMPAIQVVQLVVAVSIALVVYGQPLPTSPAFVAARLVSFALIVAGIIVLATSEQVADTFAEAPAGAADAEREPTHA